MHFTYYRHPLWWVFSLYLLWLRVQTEQMMRAALCSLYEKQSALNITQNVLPMYDQTTMRLNNLYYVKCGYVFFVVKEQRFIQCLYSFRYKMNYVWPCKPWKNILLPKNNEFFGGLDNIYHFKLLWNGYLIHRWKVVDFSKVAHMHRYKELNHFNHFYTLCKWFFL